MYRTIPIIVLIATISILEILRFLEQCNRRWNSWGIWLCIMIWFFIYCNWLPTRWQWLVDLYKKRKETAIYKEKQYTKHYKNTEHTKWKAKQVTKQEKIYKNDKFKTHKAINYNIKKKHEENSNEILRQQNILYSNSHTVYVNVSPW